MRYFLFVILSISSIAFVSGCTTVPRSPACEQNPEAQECKAEASKERLERLNSRGGRANR